MNIKKIILELYSTASSTNKSLSANSLFYIIQIKSENSEYVELQESLYVDIWKFICSYIESVEKKDYGYNLVNVSKIKKAIEFDPDFEEKVNLYNRTIRKLKECGFSKESRKLNSNIKRAYIISLFKSHNFFNVLKAFICCLFYNPLTVSIVMILFFLSYLGIILLLSNESNNLFHLEYNPYFDCFSLNYISNVFGDILEFNKQKFCTPINIWGILIILFYKSLLVLFAGWFMKHYSKQLRISIFDYES